MTPHPARHTSRRPSRRSVVAGMLALLPAAIAAGPAAAAEIAAERTTPIPPPLHGRPDAAKRFAMWGNYTCPYTAKLLPVLTRIVDDNPSRISLEWHHYPRRPPDPALLVAGLAFESDHFWNFTSAALALVLAAGGDYRGLTMEKLVEFAQAEGGSEATLKAAQADPAKWQAVKDDYMAGQLLGVRNTPGLFFDGFYLTPGGLPADVAGFEAQLRAAVASIKS